MSDDSTTSPASPFLQIRRESGEDGEYWSARELARVLGYDDFRNFVNVVNKARIACANSGQAPADHFVGVTDVITAGKGARHKIIDIHLSRYACYLIVENSDPRKEIVALGQTYFAVQTRRAEVADELTGEAEDEHRLYVRDQLAIHNRKLTNAAQRAGVVTAQHFAIFMNHGYRGLYGGLDARDIHARKGLHPDQHILDHMDSVELGANIFRATQTEDQLRREGIGDRETANQVHQQVGRRVRQFIVDGGGIPPEDRPLPAQSIQQLRQAERKRLRSGRRIAESDAPKEDAENA